MLLEKFSEQIPDWILDTFKRKGSGANLVRDLSKRLDIEHAVFTSVNHWDKLMDKIRKGNVIPVYNVYTDDKRKAFKTIYIPGVSEPFIDMNGKYRDASKISKDKLFSMVDQFGYFDLDDPRNNPKQKRADRAEARSGMVTRGEGQHIQYHDWERDEDGYYDRNRPIRSSATWEVSRGQDKSGYPVNPEKYKKMLDAVNLTTYQHRLDSFYNRLLDVQKAIQKVTTDIRDRKKYASQNLWGNTKFQFLSQGYNYLDEACARYNELCDEIEKMVSREEPEETKQQRLKYFFDYDGRSTREAIEKCEQFIKELYQAKVLGESMKPEIVEMLTKGKRKMILDESLFNEEKTNVEKIMDIFGDRIGDLKGEPKAKANASGKTNMKKINDVTRNKISGKSSASSSTPVGKTNVEKIREFIGRYNPSKAEAYIQNKDKPLKESSNEFDVTDLRFYLEEKLTSEFEDALAEVVQHEFPSYKAEWCDDDGSSPESRRVDDARAEYIQATMVSLLKYYDDSINESVEDKAKENQNPVYADATRAHDKAEEVKDKVTPISKDGKTKLVLDESLFEDNK